MTTSFRHFFSQGLIPFVLRAVASAPKLAELNPYVSVKVSTDPLDPSKDMKFLANFTVRYHCSLILAASVLFLLVEHS